MTKNNSKAKILAILLAVLFLIPVTQLSTFAQTTDSMRLGASSSKVVVTTSTGGGKVSGGGTYQNGTTVTIKATSSGGYKFTGWYDGATKHKISSDKEYTFTVTGPMSFTARFTSVKTDTGNNTGGSGSSGGTDKAVNGNNSSRARVAGAQNTGVTKKRSSNVDKNGLILEDKILSDFQLALAGTAKNINLVTVSTQNAETLQVSTIKALNGEGVKAGKAVILNANTLSPQKTKVQGQLAVSTAMLTNRTKNLKVGIYTDDAHTSKIKSTFEKKFSNPIAVIHCAEPETFGATLKVAALVDFKNMQKDNLVFYSYNPVTKTFTQLLNPDYRFDKSGYIHFNTELAGEIIISQGPLVKK